MLKIKKNKNKNGSKTGPFPPGIRGKHQVRRLLVLSLWIRILRTLHVKEPHRYGDGNKDQNDTTTIAAILPHVMRLDDFEESCVLFGGETSLGSFGGGGGAVYGGGGGRAVIASESAWKYA